MFHIRHILGKGTRSADVLFSPKVDLDALATLAFEFGNSRPVRGGWRFDFNCATVCASRVALKGHHIVLITTLDRSVFKTLYARTCLNRKCRTCEVRFELFSQSVLVVSVNAGGICLRCSRYCFKHDTAWECNRSVASPYDWAGAFGE
jgi:hypothetical protein